MTTRFATTFEPAARGGEWYFCRAWPDRDYRDRPHVVPSDLFWALSRLAREIHGDEYGYRHNSMPHAYMDSLRFPTREAAVAALVVAPGGPFVTLNDTRTPSSGIDRLR